ncbi:5-formyltetrahydrofolate cyclo-ligase [Kaistella faecalis]|uniref:5-formyltetrahydrofolate cyclo-ligase n=1 Tax=Kaistella faecalis TaxID=2852098 RepID=UPI001C458BC9|nr:5-formyltetrahydrofolate cyclo-ligase [Chryseobacterium faecale]UFK98747.1 5-formyltetrahydrofolate cyclo-ligase [Chryseobacterium faecale]
MIKSEIRKKYLHKRENLSQGEVTNLSEKIFKNFTEKFALKENLKVHCFLSIPEKGEVDTQLFLNEFFKNKIRVFVPKIYKKKLISVEITQETPLLKNSWGISEPESNEDSKERNFDYVLTPLLYCDIHGNRVGYGKGYYDGFFETVSPETLKIGLNFFGPDENIDDVWENDIALDYLITPAETLSFLGTASKSIK